jgi:excisionase family DNA binding protein
MTIKAGNSDVQSPLMTATEAADYLKIHRSTLYKMLRRGEIPGFRIGSDWRFSKETIDRWRIGQTSIG